MSRIAAIDDAARAGDFGDALELALAAWRETRDPALADAVDALGAQVPPAAIERHGYHRAWLALAQADRAADLGTLVAGLRTMLPRPERTSSFRESMVPVGWLERVAALAARADDPRLGRPLIEVMRQTPWDVYSHAGATGREVYAAPFRLLARLADVRTIPLLEELAVAANERRLRKMWYLVAELVVPVLAELRRVSPPALADDDRARCVAIAARYHKPPPSQAARVPELYAMVYADPDDDGARQVLADVLQELGDPRGELIALQLAPESAEVEKRAASVLRAHRAEWLGDLDEVFKLVEFERGFLAAAALVQNARAAKIVWERAPSDERLATVERLDKGEGNARHYSAFVFSPAMRALRTVELWGKMIARACEATAPWPFEHLILAKPPTAKEVAQLAASTALPRWSRLSFPPPMPPDERLIDVLAPLVGRLSEITLVANPATDRMVPVWFAAVDRLAPVVLSTDTRGSFVRVSRVAGALVADITLHGHMMFYLDNFAADLRTTLPPVDRMIVRPPKPEHGPRIAEAFAGFPLDQPAP